MSFFKGLFGSHPTIRTLATTLTEDVNSVFFNILGSRAYDNMVWLGQHPPDAGQLRPPQ